MLLQDIFLMLNVCYIASVLIIVQFVCSFIFGIYKMLTIKRRVRTLTTLMMRMEKEIKDDGNKTPSSRKKKITKTKIK